jgi:hypothetical protein
MSPSVHCGGDLLSLRTGLNVCEGQKICCPRRCSKPEPSSPVSSRYTYYTIPAPIIIIIIIIIIMKAEVINIEEYLNRKYKEDQFVNIFKSHESYE